jgi:hypothetical protein
MPQEVNLADAEPEMPRLHPYHDFDDLDDDLNEGRFDMDEWFLKDGSNDMD